MAFGNKADFACDFNSLDLQQNLFKCFNYTQNNLISLPYLVQNATHWLITAVSFFFFSFSLSRQWIVVDWGWLSCRARIHFVQLELIIYLKCSARNLASIYIVFNSSINSRQFEVGVFHLISFHFYYDKSDGFLSEWIQNRMKTKNAHTFQSCRVTGT